MDLITLVVGLAVFFGGGVLVNFLSREIEEWQPSFRSWLLRRAVRRLPEADRKRWLEEWAAHVNDCPGTLARVTLLIGFWFAAGGISRQAGREAKLKLAPLVVGNAGNSTTVLTISDRMCKWPIGDPSTNEFHFCGHPPSAGSPYCDAHSVIAFSGQPRKA